MKNKKESPLFKPEHIIQSALDIMKNKPEAMPRFVTDLLNIDYDFNNKTGYYKILSSEQIAGLHRIHLMRKKDRDFDQQIQTFILIGAAAFGIGYLIAELTDKDIS